MGRTRPPYAAEFKQQIVELYRAGRTPGQLASEFEPSEVTIRHWITQAEADEGRRPGVLTSTERDELRRLRRELKRVQTERDILAKATAWFARETDADAGRSSRS
jgi:transposase|tara:strand:- start:934 stop:1248 length:315 start_codon:yes stop_codon:yes gene_type:complete